jgi:hypothetical protein
MVAWRAPLLPQLAASVVAELVQQVSTVLAKQFVEDEGTQAETSERPLFPASMEYHPL